MDLVVHLKEAALMTAGMVWQTGWSLVFGFALSALLQATVSTRTMQRLFGKSGPKEVALAGVFGAASSSCSYASAAITRTVFKKGAALAPALAFLVASTNLVLELGLILLVLLGWRFMLGQWLGGVALVVLVSLITRLTASPRLVEEARRHEEAGSGHQHSAMTARGATVWARLANPKTPVLVAQNFAMEWSMLWKDLLAGFVLGGLISAFVPPDVWKAIFLSGRPGWIAIPVDALIGPLIAIVTFVCSIGNVPLAAILWAGGASFGGVLAFLYADLIVLPLLDTYRRYFGLRMAAYIGLVLYGAMVLAAIFVHLGFTLTGLVPAPDPHVKAAITHFSLNYTFWLNLLFGALALWLFWQNHRHPMDHTMHHEPSAETESAG